MVNTSDLPSEPWFAQKVEQTEVDAWLDLEPSLEGSRQLEVLHIDGAILILDRAGNMPGNRIFNLGITKPATAEAISTILQVVKATGINRLGMDVSPIARPGMISRLLAQSGFKQTDRNVVVARNTHGMAEPASYFRIRPLTLADQEDAFTLMDTVLPGAPDWCRLLAGQIERPLWRYYVAVEDGIACGLTGIHFSGDMAWMAPSWTLPEYRNRGTQAALITYAVRDAESSGIQWVTASYPGSVPGRTRNYDRHGFSIVYLRNHFVWEAATS